MIKSTLSRPWRLIAGAVSHHFLESFLTRRVVRCAVKNWTPPKPETSPLQKNRPANRLVRYLVPHAAGGFAMAGLLVWGLLANDVGGLWTLASQTDVGPMAIGVLTFFTGLTFASVQMGVAIMMLGHRLDDSEHGRRLPPGALQPVRVRARIQPRRRR